MVLSEKATWRLNRDDSPTASTEHSVPNGSRSPVNRFHLNKFRKQLSNSFRKVWNISEDDLLPFDKFFGSPETFGGFWFEYKTENKIEDLNINLKFKYSNIFEYLNIYSKPLIERCESSEA